MNELADPGQEPAEPERWSSWSESIRNSGRSRPTAPAPPDVSGEPEPEPLRPPADRSVQVRMVWNGWTGGIERVRIWNASTQSYNSVRPVETLAEAVRQAFAVPSTSTGSSASSAELLTVAEALVDPRLLAAKLVEVTVQVAAVHLASCPRPPE